ncbi:MAG TPA: alkylphosphonate utilization protein [Fusobacteriaceae bacterium]|nr:alkylphosphonate utilization protein [Fusobacteriaceae bacterium]
MKTLPNCPKCNSEYTYEDGNLMVCPECSYEWNPETENAENAEKVYKDTNGNILVDGDTVSVIKDLKVKGSSLVVKKGTKVTVHAEGSDAETAVEKLTDLLANLRD